MYWDQRKIISDTLSGGRGPTNDTSNEKGGPNEVRNKNRNGRCPDRIRDRYSREKFRGKVEGQSALGVKEDKHMDSFMVSQKEVHTYVLAKYKYPSNIA